MVEQQIRTWDVFDANVLKVFDDVPRDQFVPDYCINAAYADAEIPLAHNQCMLRPSIVGRILQSLEIQPGDDVLESGTGTGYLTACLAQIADNVTSVDLFDDFVAQASENLSALNIDNASVQCMDVTKELPDGHFDVIAVTASVATMDDRLLSALNPGGRLFIVTGTAPAKNATLVRRDLDGNLDSNVIFETDIPALLNSKIPPGFSF
jgi:protein-L-isoaspartate(D-aspartate) O-methyltransferase